MDAFEASVEEDALDVTVPAPHQGPVAVARQMDRLMSFLTSLTDAAEEVLGHFEDINAQVGWGGAILFGSDFFGEGVPREEQRGGGIFAGHMCV